MIDLNRIAVVKLAVVIAAGALVSTVALVGGRDVVRASALGPSPSFTGAPGESNCTSCHGDFPVNSGGGSVAIAGIPHDYRPGQQVQLTVTTTHMAATYWGFQLTAIDSLGRRAGTFTLQPDMPPKTQIVTGLVGGNNRDYVEHTSNGLFTIGVFDKNSWTFTWTAPSTRVGKVSFHAAGNGADGFMSTANDYIYTTSAGALSGTGTADFGGDLTSDLAVWRPSTGVWYHFNIADASNGAFHFGQLGDRITPGDYDGDGKADRSVWRPSTSTWYIAPSSGGFGGVIIGVPGDIPVPADYDGDGKTDVAVYRPSDSTFYVLGSQVGWTGGVWGHAGDKPVPGDYDADGKTDLATFRPSDGIWRVQRSSGGTFSFPFGVSEDKPVPGDYDGDGRTDLAIFRPSTGYWWVARSSDTTYTATLWGFGTDTPTPGDYDADGKTDIAVFRPSTGVWYVLRSSDGSPYGALFGISEDVPVPTGYIALE